MTSRDFPVMVEMANTVDFERLQEGFLDPQTMVTLVGRPEIKPVADEAEQRLRRACASLGGSAPAQADTGAFW